MLMALDVCYTDSHKTDGGYDDDGDDDDDGDIDDNDDLHIAKSSMMMY